MIGADLRAALDPVCFAESLGLEPDPWQARALRWTGSQALWNCSRQAGKSTLASILALHRALYRAGSLVLLVSPSLRQSSELFRKVGDWLGRLEHRPELPEDNKLSCGFENGSRIISLPSSEATVRGFSAVNLVVIDEAARVPDPLYRAVRPMLGVSKGQLITMSTPFGKRGWWFDAWDNGGRAWQRVEVPATENPRLSPEFLAEERRSMGEWWYQQEYFCKFLDSVDQVFSYDAVMGALSGEVAPLFSTGGDFKSLVSSGVRPLFGR